MMFEDRSIQTREDLDSLTTKQLVELYNQVTGRKTKKFNTRKVGLEQTWRALQTTSPAGEKAEAAGREKEEAGQGLSFRLPPRDQQKEPRQGTKRRKVFELLCSKEGALFSEVMKACKWSRKDAYEGIRLLNTYCGFPLWHERIGADDYRIHVVTPARYRVLVERENTK